MKQKNIDKKLIVILGPTASGKSKLAIKLAKKFNGEIVSADSRQVYKKMNIGTAKITRKEMKNIPHYLIDIINPNQEFNVAIYKKLAIKKIKEIQKRGKLPFLVGGTGLYIQAVVDNLNFPMVSLNKELREKLEKKTEKNFCCSGGRKTSNSTCAVDNGSFRNRGSSARVQNKSKNIK